MQGCAERPSTRGECVRNARQSEKQVTPEERKALSDIEETSGTMSINL